MTPFELETTYKKLRKGKRARSVELKADQDWIDTGIEVRIGQDILFNVTGSISIDEKHRVFPDGEITLRLNRGKPIPNPIPNTGAKVTVTGRYTTTFTGSSTGTEADPIMGILSFQKIEYHEPPPQPATLPGMDD